MSEREPQNEPDKLPEFTDENWRKFLKLIPVLHQPDNWQETMDTVLEYWRDKGVDTEVRIERFSRALALPGIPILELKDAGKYLENTKRDWNVFLTGVCEVAAGVKPKWEKIEEISKAADNLGGDQGKGEDDQAVALLETISRFSEEGKLPENFRQRLAQHAFEEMAELSQYRIMDYTAAKVGDEVLIRTTQDAEADESVELLAALNQKLWDKHTLEKETKIYRAWRKYALSELREEVAANLKKLWEAASENIGTKRKSALYFLQLGEKVFSAMQGGDAFDVDLNEEEE